MKYFACLNLRSMGLSIACLDIVIALSILGICSYHLYLDFLDLSQWQQNDVQIMSPFGTFIATLVDYVLVHEFSQAFYMIVTLTIWIKALINLVVASIMIDGIKKQRLICIAPWLINSCISMLIEIAIFVSLEIKIDDLDASVDRRIARSVIFGVFLVLNALFAYGIYALYRLMKSSTNENRALQESIVETSGMFQHVKV
ncbi:uncharacterized protein Dwil_GK27422, isoform A [Drosophila willistoni]|uniref:Uncharacterized protein, isoform A n=1 Tax=Drosophila willistoni TaxID=7260 RepID=A0A0Q9WTA0_DROWI|nr:uncharacterized protein LOC26529424 [Drosophila willistoni]KRF99455.1 uncharacterized protein Dwil_GK27422, isoform A [Drosophila willistoni]